MKALIGAFNQEKALVGAFSVIVQPVVEPMDRFTALVAGTAAAAPPRTGGFVPAGRRDSSGHLAAARSGERGWSDQLQCTGGSSAATPARGQEAGARGAQVLGV